MNTETFITGSGDYYVSHINIEGLDDLLKWFAKVNPELEKAVKDGLKEAAQPILTAARANASAIRDDGTFAASMRLTATKRGQVRLRSSDEAAGVKEFAKRGAVTLTSKGTPLASARLAKKSGVGVPSGQPPRAMYKAINANIETVEERMAETLDRILRSD